jgi:hypothetical protein
VTAELVREPLPRPIMHGDCEPLCPFCGGVLEETADHTRLVCGDCRCDALLEDGRR